MASPQTDRHANTEETQPPPSERFNERPIPLVVYIVVHLQNPKDEGKLCRNSANSARSLARSFVRCRWRHAKNDEMIPDWQCLLLLLRRPLVPAAAQLTTVSVDEARSETGGLCGVYAVGLIHCVESLVCQPWCGGMAGGGTRQQTDVKHRQIRLLSVYRTTRRTELVALRPACQSRRAGCTELTPQRQLWWPPPIGVRRRRGEAI